jgi:hypothetical protein
MWWINRAVSLLGLYCRHLRQRVGCWLAHSKLPPPPPRSSSSRMLVHLPTATAPTRSCRWNNRLPSPGPRYFKTEQPSSHSSETSSRKQARAVAVSNDGPSLIIRSILKYCGPGFMFATNAAAAGLVSRISLLHNLLLSCNTATDGKIDKHWPMYGVLYSLSALFDHRRQSYNTVYRPVLMV